MKCQEQIIKIIKVPIIIPADAPDDHEIAISADLDTVKGNLVGIEFNKESDTKIKAGTLVSFICDTELEIKKGDGVSQYKDEEIKCPRCGFEKQMGNEKWLASHCEHCKNVLTTTEKESDSNTCGKCGVKGLIDFNPMHIELPPKLGKE